MGTVNCLYCGATVPDEHAVCPECGAPSHFQKRGFRIGARFRFTLFFALLAVASILVALVLPR